MSHDPGSIPPELPPPPPNKMLERSSIEIYVGLMVGILLVVFPMNAIVRCFFLMIVLVLLVDIAWRAPKAINWKRKVKMIVTVVLAVGYVFVAASLIVSERRAEATAKLEEEKQRPAPTQTLTREDVSQAIKEVLPTPTPIPSPTPMASPPPSPSAPKRDSRRSKISPPKKRPCSWENILQGKC